MKVVCAWCGKLLKSIRADPVVSHGICDGCMAEQMKGFEDDGKREAALDELWVDVGGEG